MDFQMADLKELYRVDDSRVQLAKTRQSSVFRDEKPDKWPVMLGAHVIPVSYKTLINSGVVDYFHTGFNEAHHRADPKSFGALKSKLAQLLDEGHEDIVLQRDELLAIKTWIAMNCPLWNDYRPLQERINEMKRRAQAARTAPSCKAVTR